MNSSINDISLLSSSQEDKMIEAAFREVLDGYLASNHRKKVEVIERAYNFAREAHKGIRRRSGEPYILHPIAVAKIVSQEIGLGSTSICAALLHDVVEDTDYTVEDIKRNFGDKIAQLVDGVTKISGGIFGAQASAQAENVRKLLLTMNDDIRVVLIKLADRLHNMRTLGSMAPAKQYKIAGETLYIYAPLAHRLGLFAIKTELEDLAFKYEHPAAYQKISEQIAETATHRDAVYWDFSSPIIQRLLDLGLKFEAKARLKSVYSIWRKMETKHVPFSEVYDLYAMRIIFECDDLTEEKAICWKIYSAITDLYRLHPERTRDWVSNPKANGYQALHLTVMGPEGNWIEVQIRSKRMDEIAEKGFAAHWKYKNGDGDEEPELNRWLSTIKDILDNPEPSALDFLDTLKLNLFASEIVVFTPKGEMFTMPLGATVLDFAFTLHSELGEHCIAGKVNHKLVPLSHKLNSGDQIEILTSQTQTPKPEWLNFVQTAKAKSILRRMLRRGRGPAIAHGQQLLDKFFADNEITADNTTYTRLQGHFKIPNREELCYKLGLGEIELDQKMVRPLKKPLKDSPGMLKKLWHKTKSAAKGLGSVAGSVAGTGDSAKKEKKEKNQKTESNPQPVQEAPVKKINTKEVYVLHYDEQAKDINFKFSDCCCPLPGDDVLGFVGDNGEVIVHQLNCPRAQMLKAGYGPRIVATRWEVVNGKFQVAIHVEGIDRFGILQEITHLISTHLAIDIRRLDIEAQKEVFHCDLVVRVSSATVVEDLCQKLLKVDGVKSAKRV